MSEEAATYQPSLFVARAADPVTRAFDALRRDPLGFKAVTESWLSENRHVWRQFFEKTEALRRAGRHHYGAKAITEHMRYETAIRSAEITFKLNNNHVSGLARLYNAVTGSEFFETRDQVVA